MCCSSVKSEIGWLGLCILFFCVISICYIVMAVIYSGSDSKQTLHTMHNRVHPDHMADTHDINAHLTADNALGHGLNVKYVHIII